jgi:hypothetical protein
MLCSLRLLGVGIGWLALCLIGCLVLLGRFSFTPFDSVASHKRPVSGGRGGPRSAGIGSDRPPATPDGALVCRDPILAIACARFPSAGSSDRKQLD